MQHPVITQIERDGYPAWAKPESVYCQECGECLDYAEHIYEDNRYDCLCESCLLFLHRKEW